MHVNYNLHVPGDYGSGEQKGNIKELPEKWGALLYTGMG